MRLLVVVLMLGACAKTTPPEALTEAQPLPTTGELGLPVVTKGPELKPVDGRRVALEGAVVRGVTPGGDEGTAIELSDGTRVFVGFGEPPHGWEWLIGMDVRVEGTLRVDPGGGVEVPMLDQVDAPLPAGVGMPSASELLE